VQKFREVYGIPVQTLATLNDLIAVLQKIPKHAENLERILAYQETYGVLASA
jgi:hypothetical protein